MPTSMQETKLKKVRVIATNAKHASVGEIIEVGPYPDQAYVRTHYQIFRNGKIAESIKIEYTELVEENTSTSEFNFTLIAVGV